MAFKSKKPQTNLNYVEVDSDLEDSSHHTTTDQQQHTQELDSRPSDLSDNLASTSRHLEMLSGQQQLHDTSLNEGDSTPSKQSDFMTTEQVT